MSLERILTTELGQHLGQCVRLMDWLHRLRKMGEVNFLVLRDRTGLAQSVLAAGDLAPLDALQSETVIAVEGDVLESAQAQGGYELHNATVEVLSPVNKDIPFTLYKNRFRANLPTFLDHAVIGHRAIDRRAMLKIASGVRVGGMTLLQKAFIRDNSINYNRRKVADERSTSISMDGANPEQCGVREMAKYGAGRS